MEFATLIGVLSAVLNLYCIQISNTSYLYLISKCVPCFVHSLSLYVQKTPKAKYFSAGLMFSCLGDYVIERGFIYGLVSFLVAHLFYIFGFYNGKSSYSLLTLPVVFGSFWSALLTFIFPFVEQDLKIPVIFYGLAISSMIWSLIDSLFLKQKMAPIKKVYGFLGVLSFATSDFVLAYDHFVVPHQRNHSIVMITYFFAQIMIAGYARGKI